MKRKHLTSEDLGLEPNKTVLVLNSSYEPLNLTPWKRALLLILKNKASVVSGRTVRLKEYVRIPQSRISLCKPSRTLVLRRDNHTCQYCGSYKDLTIDHILPKSRGGKDEWPNLVTACIRCNNSKDNRTPEEWGKHLRTPRAPFNKITATLLTTSNEEWKAYLYA
jgi:5-methylcytosine-specific restriction endonuclease McrA